MRRARPMLQTLQCTRGCGRTVTSLVRPIFSSQATFARYAGICAACMPDVERAQMRDQMMKDAVRKVAA